MYFHTSSDLNDISKMRKLSVYDNVHLNESFEVAKQLANEKEPEIKNFVNNHYDANLKQSNSELNKEQITNHIKHTNEAINQMTKQLNGQSEYTQEKNSNNDTQFKNDNNDNHSNNLTHQIKNTNSFKDKFLIRKSSIPTMKRSSSKLKNKEIKSEIENNEQNNLIGKKNEKDDHKNDYPIHDKSNELIRSPSFHKATSTPSSKYSLIPRLSSPLNQLNSSFIKNNKSTDLNEDDLRSPKLIKSTSPTPIKLKPDELASPTLIKSAIKSNIPVNNSTIKNGLGLSLTVSSANDDQTPKAIKIYVPYAEIKSRNSSRVNSKNSLTSSSNSINLNGANGLKLINKKDDFNKITINVNQKYSSSPNDSINNME
jgi:hypothetical protein